MNPSQWSVSDLGNLAFGIIIVRECFNLVKWVLEFKGKRNGNGELYDLKAQVLDIDKRLCTLEGQLGFGEQR